MIQLADDLPYSSPIWQVRIKSCLSRMIINFTGWLFLSPVEIFLIKKFCLNSFAHLWKQVAILLRVLNETPAIWLLQDHEKTVLLLCTHCRPKIFWSPAMHAKSCAAVTVCTLYITDIVLVWYACLWCVVIGRSVATCKWIISPFSVCCFFFCFICGSSQCVACCFSHRWAPSLSVVAWIDSQA